MKNAKNCTYSTWILLYFILIGESICEPSYVDWGCVSLRALRIRKYENPDSFTQWRFSHVNLEECKLYCLNGHQGDGIPLHAKIAFYFAEGESCTCFIEDDVSSLRLAASDMEDCSAEDRFHVRVQCRDDLGACCDLVPGMMDAAWLARDASSYKDWMNYFPKCVYSNTFPHGSSPVYNVTKNNNVVQKCKSLAGNDDGYAVLYDGQVQFYYLCTHLLNFQQSTHYKEPIRLSPDCNFCQGTPDLNPYETCGSEHDAAHYSVYCTGDFCKRWEGLDGSHQPVFMNYFGCAARRYQDWPYVTNTLEITGAKFLEECFDGCVKAEADIVVSTYETGHKRQGGEIRCLCYHSNRDLELIDLSADLLTQGCEDIWSPDVGFPVGSLDEEIVGLHCLHDTCPGLLRSMLMNGYPAECEFTSSSSSTTLNTLMSTTRTTAKWTTTTTSTTPTSSPTSAAIVESCPETFDDRGFFWPATEAGQAVLSEQMCPNGTRGKASWTCDRDSIAWTPRQPDRTNCTAYWLDPVEAEADRSGGDAKNITLTILSNVEDFANKRTQITSGTLIRLVKVGAKLPIRMEDSASIVDYKDNFFLSEDVVNDYVQITSDLFHHELSWTEDEYLQMLSYATELTSTLDQMGFYLLKVAEKVQCDFTGDLSDSRDEVTLYLDVKCDAEDGTVANLPTPPFIEIESEDSLRGSSWRSIGITYNNDYIGQEIFVPQKNTLQAENASFVFNSGEIIKDFSLGSILDGTSKIRITFEHGNASESYRDMARYCVYWDTLELAWSDKGCTLDSYDINATVCSCNHTTSFAVIFDINGSLANLSPKALKALDILSIVLCSVSCFCCLTTVIILLVSKIPSNPRTVIQINRAATLFVLYFFLLVGLDPEVLGVAPDSFWCRFFAVGIHYFGLAAFAWTAIEGYQLYQALVKKKMSDINGKYSNLVRHVIGYGAPLLVVSITLTVAYTAFNGEAYLRPDPENPDEESVCWLSEDTFIWAFIIPAGLVILFNILVMIRAMVVVTRAQKKTNRTERQKTASNFKSFVILTFLLGVTWSFGFLMVGNLAQVFAFVFVALNGCIGIFILIHAVLFNTALKEEMKIRLKLKERGDFGFNFGGFRGDAVRKNVNQSNNLRKRSAEPYSSSRDSHQGNQDNIHLGPITEDYDSLGFAPGVRMATSIEAINANGSPSNSQLTEMTSLSMSSSRESVISRKISVTTPGHLFPQASLDPITEDSEAAGSTPGVRRASIVIGKNQVVKMRRQRSNSLSS